MDFDLSTLDIDHKKKQWGGKLASNKKREDEKDIKEKERSDEIK